MIILGKDKVDERYNIDDNGVITDLQGNIQKTKIHDYEFFHNKRVHDILIWTRFGYFDSHKFIVHHKDKNKLNNNINNLTVLSRSEHMKIHDIGKATRFPNKHKTWNKGKNISEEQREKISNKLKNRIITEQWKNKISNTMKGKVKSKEHLENISKALKGRTFSDETKKKMSEARKMYYKKKKEGY